ncbi:hypothetical protein B0H14DRAFT_2590405 [Mycena olivaceomarginata]|nr:hypothetical protein B0H14DRAFT_2590405 [Mycena olivaceomarginata]
MWVARRVENAVERKVKMIDGAGGEGNDAGCGSEKTSGVDPIDQGSAVVNPSVGLHAEWGRDAQQLQGGAERTDRAALDAIRKRGCKETTSRGRGVRGTGLCRCSPDGRERDNGEATGRQGGEGSGHGVVGVDAAAGAGRRLHTVVTERARGEGAAQRDGTGVRNRGSGKGGGERTVAAWGRDGTRARRRITGGGRRGVGQDGTGGARREGTAAAWGQDGMRAPSRGSGEAGSDGRGGADAAGGVGMGDADAGVGEGQMALAGMEHGEQESSPPPSYQSETKRWLNEGEDGAGWKKRKIAKKNVFPKGNSRPPHETEIPGLRANGDGTWATAGTTPGVAGTRPARGKNEYWPVCTPSSTQLLRPPAYGVGLEISLLLRLPPTPPSAAKGVTISRAAPMTGPSVRRTPRERTAVRVSESFELEDGVLFVEDEDVDLVGSVVERWVVCEGDEVMGKIAVEEEGLTKTQRRAREGRCARRSEREDGGCEEVVEKEEHSGMWDDVVVNADILRRLVFEVVQLPAAVREDRTRLDGARALSQMKARRRPGCLRGEKKTNQDDSAARKSSTSSPQAFSPSKSQNRQHDTTARKHRRRWGTRRRRRRSTRSGSVPSSPSQPHSTADPTPPSLEYADKVVDKGGAAAEMEMEATRARADVDVGGGVCAA